MKLEDVFYLLKDAKENYFYLAAKLKIKEREIWVSGIIYVSEKKFLVQNGRKISGQPRYRSYGPGTRITSIL